MRGSRWMLQETRAGRLKKMVERVISKPEEQHANAPIKRAIRPPAAEANKALRDAIRQRDTHTAMELYKQWRDGQLTSRLGSQVLPFQPDQATFSLYATAAAMESCDASSADQVASEMEQTLGSASERVFQKHLDAAALYGRASDAIALIECMHKHGISPSSASACCVARAHYSSSDVEGSLAWLQHACELLPSQLTAEDMITDLSHANSGFNSDPSNATIAASAASVVSHLLADACKSDALDDACRFVEVLARNSAPVHTSQLVRFISECSCAGYAQGILSAVTLCEHWNMYIDHGTLYYAMNELLVCGMSAAECERLHAAMQIGERDPPPEADVLLVHRLADEKQFKKCCEYLLLAEQKYASLHGTNLDDGSFAALAHSLQGHPELQDTAWECAKELLKKSASPSSAAVLPILSACAHDGDLDRAFAIFDEAENDAGVVPNAEMFAVLMRACNTAMRSKATPRLLEEMQSAGLQPNSKAWNAVLEADARASDTSAMVQHMQQMNAEGIRPFHALLRRAVSLGERAGDRNLEHLASQLLEQHSISRRRAHVRRRKAPWRTSSPDSSEEVASPYDHEGASRAETA